MALPPTRAVGDADPAADMNAVVAEIAGIQDNAVAYTNATLAGTWTNMAGRSAAGYCRDLANVVHLRGSLQGGTAGSTMFTLPVGFRPLARMTFQGGVQDSGAARTVVLLGVLPTGEVFHDIGSIPGAGTGELPINHISFLAEQ